MGGASAAERAICRAIDGRRALRFAYAGTRPSEREVEPHILGRSADGSLLLSGWQLSGGSGAGWRNFHVDEISDLAVTDRAFAGARPDYNPEDHSFASVICRL